MPRKPPELSNKIPCCLGNGHERARQKRRSIHWWRPSRLCHVGLLLQYPHWWPILQFPHPQLLQTLWPKQSPTWIVHPLLMAQEQPRVLGRFPLLDGWNPGEPQGGLLCYNDPSNSVDPEPSQCGWGQELCSMAREVLPWTKGGLSGSQQLQTVQWRAPGRGNHHAHMCPLSQQVPLAQWSIWWWIYIILVFWSRFLYMCKLILWGDWVYLLWYHFTNYCRIFVLSLNKDLPKLFLWNWLFSTNICAQSVSSSHNYYPVAFEILNQRLIRTFSPWNATKSTTVTKP